MPDQDCKVGVSMSSLKLSDLADGFVTDMVRVSLCTAKHPAFADVVERGTDELEVSLGLPHTRQD